MRICRSLLVAFLAPGGVQRATVVSFFVTLADAAKLREFDHAVLRWQSNPDFRAVASEYVTLGVAVMQVRFCGLRAKTVVLGFRFLPGLPRSLAVNTTSDSHYRD